LAEHRRAPALALQSCRLRSNLGEPVEGKDSEIAMPHRPTSVTIDPEQRRELGVELFNYTWTLLEKEDRTERESDRMIDAGHASRFFWEEVGEPVNHARGEWQISRAYAAAGRAEPALHHARRCLELCEEHEIGDFDLAYAYEALARALDLAGDADGAAGYTEEASQAAEHVADTADRELLLSDLATLRQATSR
jgi:tetratricopeptide (TPR) repeat protein